MLSFRQIIFDFFQLLYKIVLLKCEALLNAPKYI